MPAVSESCSPQLRQFVSLLFLGFVTSAAFAQSPPFLPGGNGTTPQDVIPTDGLWSIDAENTGQPGRGFQVETRNGVLAFTYFGYQGVGTSVWYLATGTYANGSFAADLIRYSGGTVLGGLFNPAIAVGNVGQVQLSFSSATKGTITLPGEVAKPISKLLW